MTTTADLGRWHSRCFWRRARNAIAKIVLICVFIQAFGLPRVGVRGEMPTLRMQRLRQPVWHYLGNTGTTVSTWIIKEARR
ncbi:MAG: hypothetical protein AB7G17_07210 [Phycisphaerales bacterium]